MAARTSRHRFARELLRSDDDDRLFNPLAPVISSLSTLLPAIFLEKGHREEGEAKTQGEGEEGGALTAFIVVVDLPPMADSKRPCDEESSVEPRGLPRAHSEFFRGRYFSALSSFFYSCIVFCSVHDGTCVVAR